MLNRHHDAYKVISLNKDQEDLLSDDIPRAVFFNDFGAGKIMKENQMFEILKIRKILLFKIVQRNFI